MNKGVHGMKNQREYADRLTCLKENETPHEAAARNYCTRYKISDAEIEETAEDIGTLANASIFSGQYAFCYTAFGKTPKQAVAKAIYAMGVGQRLGCGIEGTHVRDNGKAITIVFATISPEQVALLRQWDDKMKKGDTKHED